MSLELISKIEQKLGDDSLTELLERINDADFKNVYYFDEFSSYGFVRIADDYIKGALPLFDLILSESLVGLSVYGDLSDLESVKNTITNVFLDMGIRLNFFEEGEA